jgi:hypothetical protein
MVQSQVAGNIITDFLNGNFDLNLNTAGNDAQLPPLPGEPLPPSTSQVNGTSLEDIEKAVTTGGNTLIGIINALSGKNQTVINNSGTVTTQNPPVTVTSQNQGIIFVLIIIALIIFK